MDAAGGLKLTPAAKLVLAYFAYRQGRNDSCWPSKRTIMRVLGLHKETIAVAIKQLCIAGLVTETPGRAGRGYSSRYSTHLERATGCPYSDSVKGTESAPLTDNKRAISPSEKVHSIAQNHTGIIQVHSTSLEEAGEEPHATRRRSAKPFTPPAAEQVREYAASRNRPDFNAERFIDHYAPKGWRDVHGNRVRDWKGKVRAWIDRDKGGQRFDADGNQRIPDATYSRKGNLVSRPPTEEQEQELITMGIIAP